MNRSVLSKTLFVLSAVACIQYAAQAQTYVDGGAGYAPRLEFSDAELEYRTAVARREELIAWREDLLKRFNQTINAILAISASKKGTDFAKIRDILKGSELTGLLNGGRLDPETLNRVATILAEQEIALTKNIANWAKMADRNIGYAKAELEKQCSAIMQDMAMPLGDEVVADTFGTSEKLVQFVRAADDPQSGKLYESCLFDEYYIIHKKGEKRDPNTVVNLKKSSPQIVNEPAQDDLLVTNNATGVNPSTDVDVQNAKSPQTSAEEAPKKRGKSSKKSGGKAKKGKSTTQGKKQKAEDAEDDEEIKEEEEKNDETVVLGKDEIIKIKEKIALANTDLERLQAQFTQPEPKLPPAADPKALDDPTKKLSPPDELAAKRQRIAEFAAKAKPKSEKELVDIALKELDAAKKGGKRNLDWGRFFLESEFADLSKGDKFRDYNELLKRWWLHRLNFRTTYKNATGSKLDRLNALLTNVNQALTYDYGRDNARVYDFLSSGSANCDAQTALIASLVEHIEPKLGKDEVFGVQYFKDHVQPVIWNSKTNAVTNLVSGDKLDAVSSPIYKPEILFWSYLNGKGKTGNHKSDDFILKLPDEALVAKQGGKSKDVETNTNRVKPVTKYDTAYGRGDIPERATIHFQKIGSEKAQSADAFVQRKSDVTTTQPVPGAVVETNIQLPRFSGREKTGNFFKFYEKGAKFSDIPMGTPLANYAEYWAAQRNGYDISRPISFQYGAGEIAPYRFNQMGDDYRLLVEGQGIRDLIALAADPTLISDKNRFSDDQLKRAKEARSTLSSLISGKKYYVSNADRNSPIFIDEDELARSIEWVLAGDPTLAQLSQTLENFDERVGLNAKGLVELRKQTDEKRWNDFLDAVVSPTPNTGHIYKMPTRRYGNGPNTPDRSHLTKERAAVKDALLKLLDPHELTYKPQLRISKTGVKKGQVKEDEIEEIKEVEEILETPAPPQSQRKNDGAPSGKQKPTRRVEPRKPQKTEEALQGEKKEKKNQKGYGIDDKGLSDTPPATAPALVEPEEYASILLTTIEAVVPKSIRNPDKIGTWTYDSHMTTIETLTNYWTPEFTRHFLKRGVFEEATIEQLLNGGLNAIQNHRAGPPSSDFVTGPNNQPLDRDLAELLLKIVEARPKNFDRMANQMKENFGSVEKYMTLLKQELQK